MIPCPRPFCRGKLHADGDRYGRAEYTCLNCGRIFGQPAPLDRIPRAPRHYEPRQPARALEEVR